MGCRCPSFDVIYYRRAKRKCQKEGTEPMIYFPLFLYNLDAQSHIKSPYIDIDVDNKNIICSNENLG
jgi:hypothetical protein